MRYYASNMTVFRGLCSGAKVILGLLEAPGPRTMFISACSSKMILLAAAFAALSGATYSWPHQAWMDRPRTLAGINLDALPAGLRDKVAQSGLPRIGGVFSFDNQNALEASLRRIDERLRVSGVFLPDNVRLFMRLAMPLPPPAKNPPAVVAPGKILVSNVILGGDNLLKHPKPIYPPAAKRARIQGTVRFAAFIDSDGPVKVLVLEGGPPRTGRSCDGSGQTVCL